MFQNNKTLYGEILGINFEKMLWCQQVSALGAEIPILIDESSIIESIKSDLTEKRFYQIYCEQK